MSPLLFNLYVNDLCVQIHKLPVGCCCGDMIVNHIMYADDIVLLAPSGKGVQTIIDTTYAYGNAYDIIFNITKSQVMFYDTLKIGEAANIMLGDTVLNVVQTYNSPDLAPILTKFHKKHACTNKLNLETINVLILTPLGMLCRKTTIYVILAGQRINLLTSGISLKMVFIKISNKCAPMETIRLKHQNNPWINSHIIELIYERDYLKIKQFNTKMRKRGFYTNVPGIT